MKNANPTCIWTTILVALAVIHIGLMVIIPWCNGTRLDDLPSHWRNWQEFNAGFLAVYAAVLGIRQLYDLSWTQAKRKFDGYLSITPEVLSKLTHYLKDCASHIDRAWGLVNHHGDTADRRPNLLPANMELPSKEESHLITFKELIESGISEPAFIKDLHRLSGLLQINSSRMIRVRSELITPTLSGFKNTLESDLIFLADTQARIDAMYDFARGVDIDNNPVTSYTQYQKTRESIITVMRNWDIRQIQIDSISQKIDTFVQK